MTSIIKYKHAYFIGRSSKFTQIQHYLIPIKGFGGFQMFWRETFCKD